MLIAYLLKRMTVKNRFQAQSKSNQMPDNRFRYEIRFTSLKLVLPSNSSPQYNHTD